MAALIWGELPKPLVTALKELSRAEDATLFMTLLAAFHTLIHRYTGAEDILVGSPIAGRNRAEIERLIGFFVNTLVFRGDLSGDASFRTLLSRTRAAALAPMPIRTCPSRDWWRSCIRNGTRAVPPFSRSCSFCRTFRSKPRNCLD